MAYWAGFNAFGLVSCLLRGSGTVLATLGKSKSLQFPGSKGTSCIKTMGLDSGMLGSIRLLLSVLLFGVYSRGSTLGSSLSVPGLKLTSGLRVRVSYGQLLKTCRAYGLWLKGSPNS